ncbi:MAG TPA: alpha-L-arabinofuranosidase C-terminal domain-containing protein [Chryseosolibacter sp.]|nr:alpha-L-arabinofuranosidase C-terminal domain-containing protein [Chryseosolibacter sp.]
MKHSLTHMILLVLLVQFTVVAQQKNLITLQSGKSDVTISRHIYGHFAEHLGRCIYGGFYVGEKNTKIPHTDGVRNDVIEALKKLKVPNLRWPGGCFADTYHWKDGIGEKSKRPSLVNVWWGGVSEDNSFGTHDFLNMCEKIGAEPYLSANVGSGTVAEVADWVQYVNFNGVSPMSSLRKTNGRSEPWNVKYWGVGNEAWGCGGNMKPEYYANIYRQYATFMTDWGNSSKIFRIASGANSSDYNWTEVLMRDIPLQMLEGVALHHYSVTDWNKKGPSTDFSNEQYFGSMKVALRMEELVTRHSAIMDKYDPQKKVALVVDEWGGWYDVIPGTNPGFLNQQNTMRDAMIAGVTLNIFNNHADRVRMANLAQTINVLQAVILTDEERMLLTPTYHVMEMFNVHQDATLIPLTISNSEFVFQGDKLPALSASASIDSLGNTHISVVNIDATTTHDVTIQAPKKYSSVSGRILTAQKISDHNTFDNPENVAPKKLTGLQMRNESVNVKLPPFSVVVIELK